MWVEPSVNVQYVPWHNGTYGCFVPSACLNCNSSNSHSERLDFEQYSHKWSVDHFTGLSEVKERLKCRLAALVSKNNMPYCLSLLCYGAKIDVSPPTSVLLNKCDRHFWSFQFRPVPSHLFSHGAITRFAKSVIAPWENILLEDSNKTWNCHWW